MSEKPGVPLAVVWIISSCCFFCSLDNVLFMEIGGVMWTVDENGNLFNDYQFDFNSPEPPQEFDMIILEQDDEEYRVVARTGERGRDILFFGNEESSKKFMGELIERLTGGAGL